MNKKVCIIGGAGFIGWHVLDVFAKYGWEIMIYDDLSVGWRDALEKANVLKAVTDKIENTDVLKKSLQIFSPSVVLHLAAIHHIPTCEEHPQEALKVNIEGTQSVINACVSADIEKLIFTSSGAVYDIIDGPISENAPLKPRDIYGISKVGGETLVEYYTEKYQRKAYIARLFNSVGERETNDHLLPAIIRKLKDNPHSLQLGNLDPKRDYIHVKDIAAGLFALANTDLEKNYDIFNIGSGVEFSVKEMTQKFAQVLGHEIKLESLPKFCRQIDRKNQLSDNRKLMNLTNWKPQFNADQAIRDIIVESQLI